MGPVAGLSSFVSAESRAGRWPIPAHGGLVRVASDGPGKGSTFIVRLPPARGNPPTAPAFSVSVPVTDK